jgi:hypothetical protein
MLYNFLIDNREKIIGLVRNNAAVIEEHCPTSAAAKKGLPLFFDYLTRELEREAKGLRKVSRRKHGTGTTTRHGKELSRLGFTVAQVVNGYGVLREVITELARARKASISADEFATLNLSLDTAIAEAVTGFTEHEGVDWAQRMGCLVHELRNALSAAIVAHAMVRRGVVGKGDSTNILLERNLNRMRIILDRSFSDVRLQREKIEEHPPVLLLKIVEAIEATAKDEVRSKGLTFKVDADPRLQVNAEEHYLISALSNLVQTR